MADIVDRLQAAYEFNSIEMLAVAKAEITTLRAEVERLKEIEDCLRDDLTIARDEISRLTAALEKIRARRYQNRETVSPENAFEAFGRLNAEVVAIYAECDAALTGAPTQEPRT